VWNASTPCVPYPGVVVAGGLAASPAVTGAAASATVARASHAAISTVDVSSATSIAATLTGLPTDIDAVPLAALLYRRTPATGVVGGFLFDGPLGALGCDQSSAAVVVRDGRGASTASVAVDCAGACAAAGDLTLLIVSGTIAIIVSRRRGARPAARAPDAPAPPPQPDAPAPNASGNGICVDAAVPFLGQLLPSGLLGATFLSLSFSRNPAPSASPTSSPGASATPSVTPTPYPTPASPTSSYTPAPTDAPAAAPSADVVTVTVTVTAGPSPPAPPPGRAAGGASGAGATTALSAAAALAAAAVAAIVLA